jgi:hypothetical protein
LSLARMFSRTPCRYRAALVTTTLLSCSAEPPEQSKLTGFIEDTDALRARISVCLGSDAGSALATFGPEVLGGIAETTRQCLRVASDCEEVLACLGWERDSCRGAAACEGSVALRCLELHNGIRVVGARDDCSQNGGGNKECVVVDDGKGLVARCSAGSCQGDRCEGDVSFTCFEDIEVREDCHATGRICAPIPGGIACVLPERCDLSYCDGNTAVVCWGGGVDFRVDCADVIASGQCIDGGCVAKTWHPACPPTEPYSTFCDGGRAFACNVGELYEVACDQFLDSYCEAREDGAVARCRSPLWP